MDEALKILEEMYQGKRDSLSVLIGRANEAGYINNVLRFFVEQKAIEIVAQAIEAEREACAKLAEVQYMDRIYIDGNQNKRIAAAIRARSNKAESAKV